MPKLQDIAGIPDQAVELLEAVGYLDAHDLHEANAKELSEELVKANQKLGIAEHNPTNEDVEEWRRLASDIAPQGEVADAEPEADPAEGEDEQEEELVETVEEAGESVNFEEDPEVLEMLALSPDAHVLDPALIRRHKLKVAEIPEGILLSQCQGEVEINVMTTDRMSKAQRREAELKRSGLMASRIRSFEEAGDVERHHVKPLDRGKPKDVVSVSQDLNRGIDPGSRRFVRGVLHPSPGSVRTSAFFAALVQVMLVANFVGLPWLLIHEFRSGDSMLWWVVGLSLGLLVSAFCYVFWGIGARCRVCGQRQFAPKKCLKNRKAHHIPVVGYIFPTAVHALFYKWYYCIYCGTAVRLKK